MKKKPGDATFWLRTAAVSAALAVGLAAVVFRVSGSDAQASSEGAMHALDGEEKAATIQVTEGSGWLSTGEEILIAEWYSGSRGAEGDYFANFRGSDGGATVDLRLQGLNRSGTFACAQGNEASGPRASVELRVDVQNTYRSGAIPGDCKVTVTRLDGAVMEGHYQATLANSGNASDNLTITGRFRATRPQAERLSAAGMPVVAEL
jgi:hypothetical protein